MSRIGKRPVDIPAGVTVALSDGVMNVQGPKGKLSRTIPKTVQVEVTAGQIVLTPVPSARRDTSLQGLYRTLIANMVEGVTKGFQRVLEINGVGYRADVKGSTLNLALGYSHPIEYPLPEGINVEVEKQTKMTVSGIDKELVGATAAKIRSFRGPEPYKGKGIKYADERILRKAGKTGKK
ncbi:50S ribosomal protein L6 [Desulfuromonas thiophila]|jgi:large subunit ribosomal protein L6|uniref:Large ribosomal subunit protein uL6 n=1 Tax=Desulfuromonas thiophila TaxID=57664 RepID=A0A1G6YSY0_9BACT|nr:50S ribosomal protein L6 [Desulfuromonas thiophila]MCK9172105.1 50S ribosomal protein L6 [Desulfuromonas thiophila]MDD3800908.1 50S ribosomal protein L6 [Desulfuromonas thiophila]MDY0397351.1 50S ribosomal protein L6 [Desulfuromonas thiophila]SDD92755.1 LSU ribosomal protein L6P [Desulfuromonas thiophila]